MKTSITLNTDDTFFVYFSEEDDSWIGHSLRMDQIGDGIGVVKALSDCIGGIMSVLAVVDKDGEIGHLRDAPDDIISASAVADQLHPTLFHTAYNMVKYGYPSDWSVPQHKIIDKHMSFAIDVKTQFIRGLPKLVAFNYAIVERAREQAQG